MSKSMAGKISTHEFGFPIQQLKEFPEEFKQNDYAIFDTEVDAEPDDYVICGTPGNFKACRLSEVKDNDKDNVYGKVTGLQKVFRYD